MLEGDADEGRLALNSPLGTRLANLDWRPGLARLDMRDGRSPREAASLGMLLTHLDSGVGPLDQLPLAALFAWLRGQDVQAGGWQADLSRRAEGRRNQPGIGPLGPFHGRATFCIAGFISRPARCQRSRIAR